MADQIDCSWEDILPDGKLSGDVMVSILSYLPVNSLLKFKAVCKRWHSLISSPLFDKLRQSVIAHSLLLSWENIDTDLTELALLHNYDKKNTTDCDIVTSELLPSLSSIEGEVYVADSCKGLVCLNNTGEDGPERHILWNPATRRYRYIELPKKPCCIAFNILGMGYVEATNDYKILGRAYIGPSLDERYLFVYTLSSDSWKELDYDAKRFPGWTRPPTFINGSMHWLLDTCKCSTECTCSIYANKIFAFDVEDEVMCCFGVPDNYKPGSRISGQTLVIGGCLSIVIFPELVEGEVEIWVMVEYGVQESWIKQFTIPRLATIVELPLRSWRDSEILFIYKVDEEGLQELMIYALSGKKFILLEFGSFYTDSFQVFNYVESLASV